MKAEEREELKQNDMAEWMSVGLPLWLKQNGSYVLLALALGLLGWQLWNWHEKKQAAQVEQAWGELDAASAPGVNNAPEKLEGVINQYDVKAVKALAWQQIADFYLQLVAEGNPGEAYNGVKLGTKEALAKAEEAARRVIAEYPDQTLALGKAHLALGAVALDRGDWDAAKKEYEQLANKDGAFGGTAFALEAAMQLSHIEDYKKAPRLASMVVPAPPAAATTGPAGSQPTGMELPGGLSLPSFSAPTAGPVSASQPK